MLQDTVPQTNPITSDSRINTIIKKKKKKKKKKAAQHLPYLNEHVSPKGVAMWDLTHTLSQTHRSLV